MLRRDHISVMTPKYLDNATL